VVISRAAPRPFLPVSAPSGVPGLKKQIMQVPDFTTGYARRQRVAPGFPLPAVAGRMEKSSATYFRSLLRLVLWKRPRSARTATRRCPGSSRRSRGATLDISQLRSGWARTQGSCASWRDAGVSPSRQDGFGFATNPRHVVGIEGEGWSYPEPPPVRFFLYQPHPGSRLNT